MEKGTKEIDYPKKKKGNQGIDWLLSLSKLY